MTKKELFKEINKKCLEFDNKYYINSGGCCYIAAVLAELLYLYNIPYKLILYDIYGCHYAIKVSDRYLNRGGYKKKEIVSEIDNYPCEKIYGIYYGNCWNWEYNVKLNGTIKSSLIRIFNKYGKSNQRKSNSIK